MLYAIDQKDRPKDFSLKELVTWIYGAEATRKMETMNNLNVLSYPASLLIMTGALEGNFNIQNNTTSFNDIRVNPAAHLALEELAREGYQMIAQVHIE